MSGSRTNDYIICNLEQTGHIGGYDPTFHYLHSLGDTPEYFLKARLNAASES